MSEEASHGITEDTTELQPEAIPEVAPGTEQETEPDEYWKRPEPKEVAPLTPQVGLWSRSRAFRVFVWITVLLASTQLALLASSYLSGFDSAFEMLNWIKDSFVG
jgi:hypothetical protein